MMRARWCARRTAGPGRPSIAPGRQTQRLAPDLHPYLWAAGIYATSPSGRGHPSRRSFLDLLDSHGHAVRPPGHLEVTRGRFASTATSSTSGQVEDAGRTKDESPDGCGSASSESSTGWWTRSTECGITFDLYGADATSIEGISTRGGQSTRRSTGSTRSSADAKGTSRSTGSCSSWGTWAGSGSARISRGQATVLGYRWRARGRVVHPGRYRALAQDYSTDPESTNSGGT